MVVVSMMNRILDWFRKKRILGSNPPETMDGLIEMLAITEEQEVSCDDVHKVLAEFTEMQQRGEDVAYLMPLVQKHLDLCSDCREEHEALVQALEFEKQMLG
jgi:hypothetical protein